jgi:predicted nucleotide-binding protein
MSPDDIFIDKIVVKENGKEREINNKEIKRARQNVIFEYGYFVAKLTRNKVCVIHKKEVDIPSDIHGVEYIPIDNYIDEKNMTLEKK